MTPRSVLERLLDLFFPRQSLCGEEGEWVKPEEYPLLRSRPVILDQALLRTTGLLYLDRVVAAVAYHESLLLKEAIHRFKYKRIKQLEEVLGEILVDASEILLPRYRASTEDAPMLVPVPLHWTRQFERGFNQAALLAQHVSGIRTWPMQQLLKRVRSTGYQSHRKRAERFTSMKDAFRLRHASRGLSFPFVILVDDISTTGATLDQCAKALKHAGVARVEGLVVAHG